MLAQFRGYILGGFCFMLFAGASWAQIAAIEGDVKGPDGEMVKGATILIERQDMKGTYKGAKTDKKGHFIGNKHARWVLVRWRASPLDESQATRTRATISER